MRSRLLAGIFSANAGRLGGSGEAQGSAALGLDRPATGQNIGHRLCDLQASGRQVISTDCDREAFPI